MGEIEIELDLRFDNQLFGKATLPDGWKMQDVKDNNEISWVICRLFEINDDIRSCQ